MVDMLRKMSKSVRNNHLSFQWDLFEVSELSGSLRQPTTGKSQTFFVNKALKKKQKLVKQSYRISMLQQLTGQGSLRAG